MHAQDEMDIQELKDGNEPKIRRQPKIKHFAANGEASKEKESSIAKSASKSAAVLPVRIFNLCIFSRLFCVLNTHRKV